MTALSRQRLTLFVPGLFVDPLPEFVNALQINDPDVSSVLLRLLARADRQENPITGVEPRLFKLFGLDMPEGQDLPVAAVTRVADMGVIDREWWIRADPVFLEPGHDSLVMHAGLGLTPGETERLAAELNESLGQDGWLLKAPRPERWYLKPPAAAAITTTPLSVAIGRNVHPLLPQGADHKTWHMRLNEIQILLHTSPVNAARETRGLLPANSVWFWGGGRLPQPGQVEWARIWSADPLSLGLARLSGVPCGPVPANGADLLAQLDGEAQLVVLGLPIPILSHADAEAWQTALVGFARDLVTPLVASVHAGTLSELTLASDTGASFRYQQRHRWRFWRRPPQLAAYAGRHDG
jgi:hypothetical protein